MPPIMKTLAFALLLCCAASAECPNSVPCPYDGDAMYNTWDCNGVGDTRTCKFSHSKLVTDSNGVHNVVHSEWVSCSN